MAARASAAPTLATQHGPFRLIQNFDEIKDDVIAFFGKELIPDHANLRTNPIFMTALKMFMRLVISDASILATKEMWVPPDQVHLHI